MSAGPLEPKQQRSAMTRQRILDAAVDELLERGHTGLTIVGVAARARVTRGAYQHHFPRRDLLLVDALRHLGQRQIADLRAQITAVPRGRARVRRALDVLYVTYSGPEFAATLELAFAAARDPALAPTFAEYERSISHELAGTAQDIFSAATLAGPGFAKRWAMALATVRGLALLRLIGHPPEVVDRQWEATSAQLRRLLA